MDDWWMRIGGAFMAAVGLTTLQSEWRFGRRAQRTTGVITSYRRDSDEDKTAPCVAFTTAQGETVEHVSKVYSNGKRRAGQHVPMLYDPANPVDARIDTFGQRWLPSLGLLGFGMTLILLSFVED